MGDLSVTSRVADRVRLLRAQKRWSARQLAEACARAGARSLTRSTIAKIESGVRKSVTADEIAVLAQVFGVSPSGLIDVTTVEQAGGSAELLESLSDPGDESAYPYSRRRNRPFIWGSEVPFRNPHFIGRDTQLRNLRGQLASGATAVIRQPPEALYGLGGVGKTEIAAEYAHRYSGDYDVVWWIRADQEDSIRAALVGLGRRLGLPDSQHQDRDHVAGIVLDALRIGDPHERWLLIFDNVTRPGIVGRYIPQGRGDVIITSRISEWRRELRTDGIEITEFAAEETVRFLRSRIPQLAYDPDAATAALHSADEEEAWRQAQAERLAETLGNLPLAAEHAAAYLAETGEPVDEYIAAFQRNPDELLSREASMFSAHVMVATTWNVARDTLSPQARALFETLAFFSPEPIPEEVLVLPGRLPVQPPELAKVLSSHAEFRRAARELSRFSLAKINGVRSSIQVHQVVQAVTRGRIEREDPGAAAIFRETVHALLAASDPGAPEEEQNDPIYERSLRHLIPTGALESANPLVRNLIINQVRRLHLRGRYGESLSLGERALSTWREKFGPDDLQTLALAVEVATAARGRLDGGGL
jgi:transcriptional regulator with XRE-family HTH domain